MLVDNIHKKVVQKGGSALLLSGGDNTSEP